MCSAGLGSGQCLPSPTFEFAGSVNSDIGVILGSGCSAFLVIPGLVPGIHVDGQVKPGHDDPRAVPVKKACQWVRSAGGKLGASFESACR